MFFMKDKFSFVLALSSIFISNIVAIVRQIMSNQYIIILWMWLICVQKFNIDYILNGIINVDHESY